MSDEPYVRIGIGDVYQSLQRVVEGNQRLDAKLEAALSNQTLRLDQTIKDLTRVEAHLENLRKDLENELDEHDKRIVVIDRRPVVTPRHIAVAASVMTTIITVGMGIIGLFIKGG
jgi:hypothetical protein